MRVRLIQLTASDAPAAVLTQDCRAAVLAEVAETGLGRLSMEGVARRAGVAKTSIYRHWSSVEDLLLDALRHAYPAEVPSPRTDSCAPTCCARSTSWPRG